MPTTRNEPSPGTPRLAGVIVTHAGLAGALCAAAAEVAGDVSALATLSNEGRSQQDLGQEVRALIESLGASGCIVFVDSRGSSCATGCLNSLRDLPQVRVISGVNLPMLVDFLLRRNDYDLDAMAERLVQRGRNSVQLLKGSL